MEEDRRETDAAQLIKEQQHWSAVAALQAGVELPIMSLTVRLHVVPFPHFRSWATNIASMGCWKTSLLAKALPLN